MQAQARVPAPHNQKREEYDKNQELSRTNAAPGLNPIFSGCYIEKKET
jgi:hypothetical protein